MKPQWYYCLDAKSHGPVTLAEVNRLLKWDRLKPTDKLRHIQSADWMLVSDFLAMRARQEQAEQPDEEPDEALGTMVPPGPGLIQSFAAQAGESVRESIFRCGRLLSRFWELMVRLPELRRSWITAAALAVIAFAYAFKDIKFLHNETQDTMSQLLAIEQELDLLQGPSTSDAEWSDFQQSAQETLVPLQEALEKLARNSPRLRSHYWTEAGYRESVARSLLIQACQTLKKMVDSRGGDDGLRAHFHRRFNQAHAQVTFDPATVPAGSIGWDPLTLPILGLDVVLVLGAACWWVRRSQRTPLAG